ncbi:MAG: 2-oxoglutarate:ferredoxin oxidoreductase, partial [Nitrospinaceae bacterium]|nr:2-oxoglutarate:ferredoxin oxidoreductase [Nitrospinaceae bacterium]NIR53681.1 2-oxoglutarate:ferredoxin oxidoreductase [Nitrospinaceae bacterium]NIS84088.1 2-oxoglutarate:ferredoxin oxidoreductase [Nitrospinaceae bacterium]NIT80892.1 2-oxoglutarate:ferredoxin oxidoreductase [Nitrospinaceae bacterium]NIU43191.1 2-oxoglutarate:ferredoxin oxidoreductase [Nitrospinaceae bacterium]
ELEEIAARKKKQDELTKETATLFMGELEQGIDENEE